MQSFRGGEVFYTVHNVHWAVRTVAVIVLIMPINRQTEIDEAFIRSACFSANRTAEL